MQLCNCSHWNRSHIFSFLFLSFWVKKKKKLLSNESASLHFLISIFLTVGFMPCFALFWAPETLPHYPQPLPSACHMGHELSLPLPKHRLGSTRRRHTWCNYNRTQYFTTRWFFCFGNFIRRLEHVYSIGCAWNCHRANHTARFAGPQTFTFAKRKRKSHKRSDF